MACDWKVVVCGGEGDLGVLERCYCVVGTEVCVVGMCLEGGCVCGGREV